MSISIEVENCVQIWLNKVNKNQWSFESLSVILSCMDQVEQFLTTEDKAIRLHKYHSLKCALQRSSRSLM